MVSRTEPSAKVMVSRAEHSEKAYQSMNSRLAGKASEVTPVLEKALSPMVSRYTSAVGKLLRAESANARARHGAASMLQSRYRGHRAGGGSGGEAAGQGGGGGGGASRGKLRTTLATDALAGVATEGGGEGAAADTVHAALRELLTSNAVRVIDLFREWDEDGNGQVSASEFRRSIGALGYEGSSETINELFASFDTDGSGSLDYRELSKRLRRGVDIVLQDKRLHDGAQEVDVTRNAIPLRREVRERRVRPGDAKRIEATVANLRSACMRNHARVIDLLRRLDTDGDGRVSKVRPRSRCT